MSNPYNLSNPYLQNQSQVQSGVAPGTSVPRGWTTNAAPPTETYQPSFNFQDYSPINLTSGLYEGVGYGKPIFYQNKNTGKYSAYKNEYSLGGDMYAKLNADWVKSIGGKDGGFGWEFDFDPTSQLYGNESNALVGRKVGNQNSLKAVGGELLRMASIPAMAYGVGALQNAGYIGGASGGLQPIAATGTNAAATGAGASGAATAASGAGAGGGVFGGAISGGGGMVPAGGASMAGSATMGGSGIGAMGGTGLGAAGTGMAAGGAAAPSSWSILNPSSWGQGMQSLASSAANNPWDLAKLGLSGLGTYLNYNQMQDIQDRMMQGTDVFGQGNRQYYQDRLRQLWGNPEQYMQDPSIQAAFNSGLEAVRRQPGMALDGRMNNQLMQYGMQFVPNMINQYTGSLSPLAGASLYSPPNTNAGFMAEMQQQTLMNQLLANIGNIGQKWWGNNPIQSGNTTYTYQN